MNLKYLSVMFLSFSTFAANDLSFLIASRDFTIDSKGVVALRSDARSNYNFVKDENGFNYTSTEGPKRIVSGHYHKGKGISLYETGINSQGFEFFNLNNLDDQERLESRTSRSLDLTNNSILTCTTLTPELCRVVNSQMAKFREQEKKIKECNEMYVQFDKEIKAILDSEDYKKIDKSNREFLSKETALFIKDKTFPKIANDNKYGTYDYVIMDYICQAISKLFPVKEQETQSVKSTEGTSK